jgi:hypothetical protein
VTVIATLCEEPPAVSDTEPPALIAITGAASTVTLNVVVAFETPLPLAVTVAVTLLTGVALAAAVKLMDPEFPVPGWVISALTPDGSPVTLSETLPV